MLHLGEADALVGHDDFGLAASASGFRSVGLALCRILACDDRCFREDHRREDHALSAASGQTKFHFTHFAPPCAFSITFS